ncbi:MFS transporter [Solirubrobacter ginsenosidimutans]|uniref:MFS transporter n=1 Tax=Solirubrobacter ginsenosidimutans TaxID=490573 RepID=UPI0027E221EF|nr:MFS transporter [Solirubrobacter ginsenosidimutans]
MAAAFGLFMIGLDGTIVAVANPTIGHHFHASLADLQWVTNAYLLALAVTLISGGKLGDQLGRKRIFLIGTAGFALASLACGLSTSLGELIAFRAAQGLFGAMMVPQTLAILRATFPIEKLAVAIGLWTMSSTIGIASGPIVGGVLISHASWRWIFLVNVPVAVVSMLVGTWVIRESRDQAEGRRFDLPGIALLTGTLFTLLWGLIDAEKRGWGHFTPIAWLISAALLLVLFVVWEIREERIRQPHIPLSLFRSAQFSAGVVMALAVLMGYYSVLFFVTLYFQRVHGYTASQTGVRLLALTGVMGISAIAGSRAVAKIGPRVPLLVGALLSAAGLLGLSRLGPHTSFSSIWPFLALVGLGFGPAQTAFARAIVGGAPPGQAGIAGGMTSTAVQVGGMLGLSVLGSVIVSRVTSTLPDKLTRAGVPSQLVDQLQGTGRSIAQGIVPIPRGLSASTAQAITKGDLLAFTAGLDAAMAIAAAIVFVTGIVAFVAVGISARATRVASGARRPWPLRA